MIPVSTNQDERENASVFIMETFQNCASELLHQPNVTLRTKNLINVIEQRFGQLAYAIDSNALQPHVMNALYELALSMNERNFVNAQTQHLVMVRKMWTNDTGIWLIGLRTLILLSKTNLIV